MISMTQARAIDTHNANYSRPFLKWVGGKSQLLTDISSRIPETFGRYFEPFVGGGAIFFSLRPDRAVLIDINPELINAYTVVRDDVEGLIKELSKHRYVSDYFYQVRNADRLNCFSQWSPARRAARLIFLNKTCINGLYRVNSKGQFNVPFGQYTNPRIVDADNLRACSQALQGVELLENSFLEVQDLAQSGDFVYFDPPYAPLNATSNFTSYSQDGFSFEQHISLRDLCVTLHKKGVRFLLSNSNVAAIRELYEEKRFKVRTVYALRAVNSKGYKRGKIVELLIANE